MGGPSDAKNGELISMISGDKKSYEKMHNIFDKISKHVFYLGEDNGISNSIKLALNLNIAIISLALSEGIILAIHSGIDPEVYLKIFNLTKLKTGISENKGQKNIKKRFFAIIFFKKYAQRFRFSHGNFSIITNIFACYKIISSIISCC